MILDDDKNTMDNSNLLQGLEDAGANQITREQWLAIRKEAGLKIDPRTAEVMWTYALTLDPYGVGPELPEEWRCVGRAHFARSP